MTLCKRVLGAAAAVGAGGPPPQKKAHQSHMRTYSTLPLGITRLGSRGSFLQNNASIFQASHKVRGAPGRALWRVSGTGGRWPERSRSRLGDAETGIGMYVRLYITLITIKLKSAYYVYCALEDTRKRRRSQITKKSKFTCTRYHRCARGGLRLYTASSSDFFAPELTGRSGGPAPARRSELE